MAIFGPHAQDGTDPICSCPWITGDATRRLVFFIASAGLLSPSLPSLARASCVAPTPEILWSLPEDGAIDVPIDAQIWVLTSVGASTEMTLNGETVEAASTGTFSAVRAVATLEADTSYVLQLVFPESGDGTTLEIEFSTGDRSRDTPSSIPVIQNTVREVGWPDGHDCVEIVEAQDCFDTGQDTLLTFDLRDQDDAVAWLITSEYQGASTVWPRHCGDPAIFGAGEGCFDVQAISQSGALSLAAEACASGEPVIGNPGAFLDGGDPGTGANGGSTVGNNDPGTGGCSVGTSAAAGQPPHLAYVMMGLFSLIFVLRRRR